MEFTVTNKRGEKFTVLYDECDHELINSRGWYVQANGYVMSTNKYNPCMIHRLIMGVYGRWNLVDHINRNRLDNRRSNLRKCTPSENARNRKSIGSSKYLGVRIAVAKRKDRTYAYVCAGIKINGKSVSLGTFKTEEAAARAYDAAAKIHHGEFAYLNFPDE